jgi:hypothetical protein
MTVARLIEKFSTWKKPVLVSEVRDQIVEWGYYDRIQLVPFDRAPGRLQGMIIDYEAIEPYATKDCCVIRYNENLSSEEQRLVCVKELVHCMDGPTLRVSTRQQLNSLLEEILHDPKTPAADLGHIALFEDVAIYQALAILGSEEDRENLFQGFHERKNVQLDEVATRFRIPIEYAGYLMIPNWKLFRHRLLSYTG